MDADQRAIALDQQAVADDRVAIAALTQTATDAKTGAEQAAEQAATTLSDTQKVKSDTAQLKTDTAQIKADALSELNQEGSRIVSEVTDEGNVQKGRAQAEADRAESEAQKLAHISNPNLLINGDFGVWQRGSSFNNLAFGVYTADRWSTCGSGTSVEHRDQESPSGTNAPIITVTGQWAGLRYIVEACPYVKNQQLTLSFWVKGISGSHLRDSYLWCMWKSIDGTTVGSPLEGIETTGFADTSGEWKKYIWTFTPPEKINNSAIHLEIRFHLSSNTSPSVANKAQLSDMKLEIGNKATPFIPDDPATNLAKCQRYFQSLGSLNWTPASNSNVNYSLELLLPVTMRTTPTASYSGSDITVSGLGPSESKFWAYSYDSHNNSYRYIRDVTLSAEL